MKFLIGYREQLYSASRGGYEHFTLYYPLNKDNLIFVLNEKSLFHIFLEHEKRTFVPVSVPSS